MLDYTLNHIQVELDVPDFDPVLDFYGKLGFNVAWIRREGDRSDYLVMERSGTVLNFWPGNESVWDQPYFKDFPKTSKRGYGVEIVIPVTNIDDFYAQVKSFSTVVGGLKMQPWGVKDFRIEDPNGYYLRITEPHNTLDPAYSVPKHTS